MLRLAVRVRREHAELVLADLLDLAPSGVEEVELDDGVIEYAVYGAPGELPALPDVTAAAGDALVQVSTTEVPDDWPERWRSFHRPVVIGKRLLVRPPWEAAQGTRLDVVIDPGQAFGTGAHATTRLCLELMLSLPECGGSFLDIGCGSGVLGIVAGRLGFEPVLAVDNDPEAVAAARTNAERNSVPIEVHRRDLRHHPLPASETVASNLLAPLLVTLAKRLDGAPWVPRRLIAGGLLAREADGVAVAFAPVGLREIARRTDGDWAAILLQVPSADR
jgi:ribosomal protein L11 methyltransferase